MTELAVTRDVAEQIAARFSNLRRRALPGLRVDWEPPTTPGILLGTARLETRCQPFRLQLCSLGPLEQQFLPGNDAALDTFRQDLDKETRDDA